jgi:hypothetical protein
MVQQLRIHSHNSALRHLLIIHPGHLPALKLPLLVEGITNSSIVYQRSNIIPLPLTHALCFQATTLSSIALL